MRRTLVSAVAFLVVAGLVLPGLAAKKKPKYYITFRETLEAPGVVTGVKDKVRPLLLEELRKYPEFVLDLPDAPGDPEALKAYFKKNKLKGYEINIRLTKLVQKVIPPKPGERFKTLAITIAATIFGTSFPDKSFAVGGDGESTVEFHVRQESLRDVEVAKGDALKDAIQQAVVKTLRQLEVGQMVPPPEKSRKKK
jgi:hypothetical protein